ncbi:MAG TPA: MFS transporter [Acidimicrobiales bacterium]|nr:MFS transporter [Acidimicrobiales bacterium]
MRTHPSTRGVVADGIAADDAVEDFEDALIDGDRTFAPGSARSALRHRTFRRVFTGSFLSNVGTWMQNVVLGALAYDLTESPTFVGIVLFAQLGPLLLLSVVGGALADTIDRRRLLMAVAASQLVLSFVLAAVAAPDQPDKVLLVAVVFCIGIAQALFNPAYTAVMPQLVGRDDLPGAISLHSAQMNGSRVIGPVIGALLDAALGASAVFALNGLTYLFVIASLTTVRLPPPVVATAAHRGLRRLGAGFAVARGDRVVRRCLVSIFTFSLVSLTFVGQFPVVAERNFGIDERSTAYGLLYACFGVGAVAGALSIGTIFSRRPKERIVRVALASYAVALAVFALLRSPAVAYPAVLVVGLTYFGFITSLSTVLQQRLGDHERGSVTALWIMGFGGTVPIGNLLAGPIIEASSITAVLLGGAVFAAGLAGYARLAPTEAGAAVDLPTPQAA